MENYLALAAEVLEHGTREPNRTDTPATKLFGSMLRFDLTGNKIAAVTTKQLFLDGVIHELIWMLSGSTNIRYLQDNGVHIWDEWADEHGELGPVYGQQWRNWRDISRHGAGMIDRRHDQIATLIDTLLVNPTDRRMLVNSWNVGQLDKMALPPCHYAFQIDSAPATEPGGKRQLRLLVNQRSVDLFLGLPFNLAFYSILAHVLAHFTNHEAVELFHVGGNVHIYDNHRTQMEKQIKRKPKTPPTLRINPDITEIDDLTFHDIEVIGYTHHPKLTGKVAV